MKQGVGFRLLAAILVYTNIFWPTVILAEIPGSAGVIASLKGQAVVVHAAQPGQPEALKFKDPVFGRDRISTKEESVARVLLGGKALITVRELSDLTITEEPNKPSVVDVFKGKIAMAVARERMQPGEAIEIRTPNAVAAVRGTVLIVEVEQKAGTADAPDYKPVRASFTGQATPVQAPSFITNFHVLQGNIDVKSLGQPGAAPVNIGAGLSLSVVGGSMGTPQSSPPVQQLIQGLGSGPQHTGTPGETTQTITTNQVNTATNLGNVITGGTPTFYAPPPPTNQNVVIPTTGCTASCSPPPPALGAPLVTFSGFGPSSITLNAPLGLVESGAITTSPTPQSFPTADVPAPDVTVNPIGSGASPGVIETPYYATVASGETVVLSGGIGLTDSHVAGASNPIFRVSGVDAVLEGSALILQNSSISTTDNVITINAALVGESVVGGSLLGTSSNALITLDSTSSISANRLVSIEDGEGTLGDGGFGNSLGLVGPVLASNGGTVTVSGDLIYVGQNGFLGVASGLALVNLANNSTLQASRLLNIYSGGMVELGGSLLLAQDSMVSTSNTFLNVSGTLIGDGTSALIQLNNSSLTVAEDSGAVVSVTDSGTMTLKGPLLTATNSPISADTILDAGGTVNSMTTSPLITLNSGSNFTSTITNFGGLVDVDGSLALAGPMLSASGVTITTVDTLVDVDGTVTSTTTSPLISLTNSTINSARVLWQGGTGVTLAGPLLAATNTTFNMTGNMVDIGGTTTLSSSTTQPLVQLSGGSLNLGGSFLSADGATVTLAGGLFKATDAILNPSTSVPLMALSNGSSLTAGGPLMDLTNSPLDLGAQAVVSVTNGSSLTVNNGPVIKITGGSLTAEFIVQTDGIGNHFALTGGLLDLTNTTVLLSGIASTVPDDSNVISFTLGSGQPFINLTNSSLTLTGSDNLVEFGNGNTPTTQNGVALIATNTSGTTQTLSLGGALLHLKNVNMTDTNAQIQLSNMTVTQTGTTDSLIKVTTEGAEQPVTLHGPLLSATNSAITVNYLALLNVEEGSAAAMFSAGTLDSPLVSPLVSLNGGTLTLNSGAQGLRLDSVEFSTSAAVAGTLFSISNGAIVNTKLSGQPFIGVNGGTLAVAGDVVNVAIPSSGAGGLIVNAAAPVMAISGGGTHKLVDPVTNPTSAIFNLSGVRTAPQTIQVDDAVPTPATVNLTLGSDSPIRGDNGEGSALGSPLPVAVPLFQATNATVNTNQAVKIDTALLEATAPLINLLNNSMMNSSSDLVNLVQKAKVMANLIPSDALIKLDASMLNVTGSVFNVAGGSYLNVTGNLVSLNNNSILNITNGALVTVSGGSVFSLMGSLVNFGGAGTNTLNITTNTSCSGCSLVTVQGIPVLLENSALQTHVSVSPSFVPVAGSGTITLNGNPVAAPLLVLNGANSRIRLHP